MIALSIRQPWAWLIVHGHKDVENRSWATEVRGRFLVHAGKTLTKREYAEALEFIRGDPRIAHIAALVPPLELLERGGIVGEATLTGSFIDTPSPWFTGDIALGLRDATPHPFLPWKGQLGWFTVPWPPTSRPTPGPQDLFGGA